MVRCGAAERRIGNLQGAIPSRSLASHANGCEALDLFCDLRKVAKAERPVSEQDNGEAEK